MLELAARIVKDYGTVLGRAKPGIYGLPESLLPHSREQIRSSIRFLLKHVDVEDVEIKQSLVHGYVYLAQFVPDRDMEIISAGQSAAINANSNDDDGTARDAMRLINRIKLAMETALKEVTELVQGSA